MDKDRIIGAAKTATGVIKEAAGNAVGNPKLVVEGKTEQLEGKVQTVIGKIKDAVKP